MRRIGTCLALVSCLVIAVASVAFAGDEPGRAYGIRIGLGLNPDQVVAGFQADFGKVYRNVRFVPSIDAGLGDHLKNIGFNGDLKMFLPLPKAEAAIYVLAGPTIEIWSPDEGEGDTEIGVYLGSGIRMGMGEKGWYNLEARFGIGDVPEIRILLGILFGGR